MADETEYPYEKQVEYDTLLSTLSESEREACENMAIVDSTRFGLMTDILHKAFNIEDTTLNSLVEKDVLESKPLWEFHKEFLDTYRETVEAIYKRIHSNDLHAPLYKRSSSEESILNTYLLSESIVEKQDSTLSYRFKDSDLREYIYRLNKQKEEMESPIFVS